MTASCKPNGLALVMYSGSGWTMWHHKSEARLSDVLAPGYFDPASTEHVAVGDAIYVQARDACAWAAVAEHKTGRLRVAQLGSAAALPAKRSRTIADLIMEAAQ